MGVSVTEPVPMTILGAVFVFKFTLLKVCVVTELPLLGEEVHCIGLLDVLDEDVVMVRPLVDTASVLISRV